jgi:outer membrane autotransporter protein
MRETLSDAGPISAQTGARTSAESETSGDRGRGAWLRVYGANNNTSGDGNAFGYRIAGSGVAVGVDAEPTRHSLVGIAVGYGHQRLSVDTIGDSGSVDVLALALYGQYSRSAWTFKASGAVTRNDNHSDRNVAAGGAAVASADFHSSSKSLYGEASYGLGAGRWAIHPLAAISYVRLANPGFTESGAGALNLTVASDTRHSFRSYVGAKAIHIVRTGNGALRVEPRLLWTHEFGNVETAPISAQITGGGAAASFRLQGVAMERDGALLGLSLSGQLRTNLTLLGDVSFEARNRQQSSAVLATLKYVW